MVLLAEAVVAEELFVGIVSAKERQYGMCVCIDALGREAGFTRFAWSPKGLATLLGCIRHEAEEVMVGVERGSWDLDMARVLVGSPVASRMLRAEAIDALVGRVPHQRAGLRARAGCIAVLLLASDYPLEPARPERLALPLFKPQPVDWMTACQRRLLPNVEPRRAV